MIRIDPNALYSRSDLADMLAPMGVDVDLFIGRLKPRKVFKVLWLGEDILAALRSAPSLGELDELQSTKKARSVRAGKRRSKSSLITLDEVSGGAVGS